jgi:hypothetical protein
VKVHWLRERNNDAHYCHTRVLARQISACAQHPAWKRSSVKEWAAADFSRLFDFHLGDGGSRYTHTEGDTAMPANKRVQIGHSISRISETMASHAKVCGARKIAKSTRLPTDDAHVVDSRSTTSNGRNARDKVERHIVSNKICKLRRQIRRKRARVKKSEEVPFLMRNNCMVFRPDCKSKIGFDLFKELLNSHDFIVACQWLFRAWDPSVLAHLPRIDGLLVRKALRAMSKAKTSGRTDV